MASICKLSFYPNPNPALPTLSSPPSSVFKPQFPSRVLTLKSSIRASQNQDPNPQPAKSPIITVIKPTVIALTASAAVFFSRHPGPSLAIAIPTQTPTLSETLTDEIDEKTIKSRLKANPNDISALRTLMELKVKARKLPEAIKIADRLIAIEPEENDLLLLKAHLQCYSGDVDAAKLAFEEILSKNPYLVEAYHGLVMMASQSGENGELNDIIKRVESAMTVCEKEKRKEELKDFKLLVAQVQVIEGKYAEALEIYQGLVKEEPKDFRPYLCQGIIYTLLRKKDEADKQFEKYRKFVPKGHPYAQYFEHNMNAMKGFSQME